MRRGFFCLLVILLPLFLGCSHGGRYDWGSYEDSLYRHYRHPTRVADFSERLARTIVRGEERGLVPPGVYAEYGYVQYVLGDKPSAISYYEKEKAMWPESAFFMDKMIAMVEKEIAAESDEPQTTGAPHTTTGEATGGAEEAAGPD